MALLPLDSLKYNYRAENELQIKLVQGVQLYFTLLCLGGAWSVSNRLRRVLRVLLVHLPLLPQEQAGGLPGTPRHRLLQLHSGAQLDPPSHRLLQLHSGAQLDPPSHRLLLLHSGAQLGGLPGTLLPLTTTATLKGATRLATRHPSCHRLLQLHSGAQLDHTHHHLIQHHSVAQLDPPHL